MFRVFCRKHKTYGLHPVAPFIFMRLPPDVEAALHLELAQDFKSRVGDGFAPISAWPPFWRRRFFKPHKNFEERRSLWLFLWHNGLEPGAAAEWVLWHHKRGRAVVPLGYRHLLLYDSDAFRSMSHLVTQSRTAPRSFDRYKVYDLIEGKVM